MLDEGNLQREWEILPNQVQDSSVSKTAGLHRCFSLCLQLPTSACFHEFSNPWDQCVLEACRREERGLVYASLLMPVAFKIQFDVVSFMCLFFVLAACLFSDMTVNDPVLKIISTWQLSRFCVFICLMKILVITDGARVETDFHKNSFEMVVIAFKILPSLTLIYSKTSISSGHLFFQS